MFGWESIGYAFWWVFPLIFLIVMIVLCLFMMRGCVGCMMGRYNSHDTADRRGLPLLKGIRREKRL